MYKILILIITIIPFNFLVAQTDTIKVGAFKNYSDFMNNKPFITKKFKMTYKDVISNYPVYKVVSDTPKVKKDIINNQTWGIYNGESFYINSIWVNMQKGYIKVLEYGQYSYLEASPTMNAMQQQTIKEVYFTFGVVGGVLSTAAVNMKNSKNTHYILNLNNGSIQNLNKDYLNRILETEPDLFEQYNNEDKQEDMDILLKYIKLLNERFR